MSSRVIVVGAGLGGLRAAEQLRAAGFTGVIDALGAEAHMPYNRPPLSKEALSGGVAHADLAFRPRASVADVSWHLGTVVAEVDLDARTLQTTNGQGWEFDALVAATGVAARRLPLDAPLGWRHVVRTLDDAAALRVRLLQGGSVVVVGAGFIGCEVAATAALLGCTVHVVDPLAVPLARPLGPAVGTALQRHHEAHGVVFHLGRTVAHLRGDETGPRELVLDDGTALAADVVVEAVGSAPVVDWLEGQGLDLSDGVTCDDQLRAGGRPGIVAVGDIARFPNVLFDAVPRRVEHWNVPTETAKRAARTLVADLAGQQVEAAPFTPMPAFWSDQYDLRLQSFGMPGLGEEVVVVEGALDAPEFAAAYTRAGVVVGVVLVGLTSRYTHYRDLVAARASL